MTTELVVSTNNSVSVEVEDVIKSPFDIEFPVNEVLFSNFLKCWNILHSGLYDVVLVGISGGSDSDCVMQLMEWCKKSGKCPEVHYFHCDTGIELQATKDHLCALEQRYGCKIERYRSKMPVVRSCKVNGEPFLNKNASTYISRLQSYHFDFANEYDVSYEELVGRYCRKAIEPEHIAFLESTGLASVGRGKNAWVKIDGGWYNGCISALQWWTDRKGEGSMFSIKNNRLLKEFLRDNPPAFKISAACCDTAKKSVMHRVERRYSTLYKGRVLCVSGVRLAEGATRKGAYGGKGCWSRNTGDCDAYRPLQWWSDADKKLFCDFFGVEHSRAYSEYGCSRTGCACCPLSLDGGCFKEAETLRAHGEEQLVAACENIFKNAFDYTKLYQEYVRKNYH